jgi:hypothetical protein
MLSLYINNGFCLAFEQFLLCSSVNEMPLLEWGFVLINDL